MKYTFIEAQKAHFKVTILCMVLGVSSRGFYAWRHREPSQRTKDDAVLLILIKAAFSQSRQTYGSPRIHKELQANGHRVGEKRVARLMSENGLVVRSKPAFRCTTTQSDPTHAVAPNILDRDFNAAKPNEKWVTDTTYINTSEGWLYLAAILDLYNREVVGWAMGQYNDKALTLRALDMAVTGQKPAPGLIHHSDRGSTYTAHDYRDQLTAQGMVCSMSRKGDCWDNSVAESFFSTLKKDLVHRYKFTSRRQAAASIFEYIEVFYNRVRRHSHNGYMTPVEFRRNNTVSA